MVRAKRTSGEWFEAAVRSYVERHQGCAWCGGSHRVFKQERGGRVEYYCNGCDFRVSFDLAANTYVIVPGEDQREPGQATMYEK